MPQIKEMFADEPLQLVDASSEPEVTMDDVDLTEPEVKALSEADLAVEAVEVRLMPMAGLWWKN